MHLCDGKPLMTGEFSLQGASYAQKVSLLWRHHDWDYTMSWSFAIPVFQGLWFAIHFCWLIYPLYLGTTTIGDVTMSAMASQISSLTIVYSTIYSGVDQRKYQSSASLAFVLGIHSNAENVSIWWRHHEMKGLHQIKCYQPQTMISRITGSCKGN